MGVPYIDSGVPDIRDLPNVTLHNTKVNTLETPGTISGGATNVTSLTSSGAISGGATTVTSLNTSSGAITGGATNVTSLTSSGTISGGATTVTSLNTSNGPITAGAITGAATTVTSLECSGALTAEGLTAGPVTVDSLTTVDGGITTALGWGIYTGLIHAPTTGSDLFLRLKGGHASASELHVGAYDIYYRGSKHFFYGRSGGSGLMHSNSQYGGIFFNGNVFWSSDNRLKHNEEDITDALGTIRKLNAQKYQKTDEPKEADFNGELTDYYIEETGFIAQDVMEIPELAYCVTEGVTAEGKEIYNLKYTDIFVVNVQAVKELDAIVQSQQTKIDSLEARLTALENKN
jgi:hypothetical protein